MAERKCNEISCVDNCVPSSALRKLCHQYAISSLLVVQGTNGFAGPEGSGGALLEVLSL